jgi:hypothetical protein
MARTGHLCFVTLALLPVASCGSADTRAQQTPPKTVVVRAGTPGIDEKLPSRPVKRRVAPEAGTLTCDSPNLVWRTANKTNYTSFPEPGSEECIKYSGCKYQGMFSACGEQRKSLAWVKAHNIAALFPLEDMALHNICIRAGSKTMEVTVYDTCGDHDCNGCCTRNKGKADALVDLESFTNDRFGKPDGPIQWADLGIKGGSCSD